MMKVCVQPRSGGRRAYSVRHEKRRGRFSLSPREERAGRELERGETDEKRPPLPDPSPPFLEEREKGSARALQANYLPNRNGVSPAVEPRILPGGTSPRIPQSVRLFADRRTTREKKLNLKYRDLRPAIEPHIQVEVADAGVHVKRTGWGLKQTQIILVYAKGKH